MWNEWNEVHVGSLYAFSPVRSLFCALGEVWDKKQGRGRGEKENKEVQSVKSTEFISKISFFHDQGTVIILETVTHFDWVNSLDLPPLWSKDPFFAQLSFSLFLNSWMHLSYCWFHLFLHTGSLSGSLCSSGYGHVCLLVVTGWMWQQWRVRKVSVLRVFE